MKIAIAMLLAAIAAGSSPVFAAGSSSDHNCTIVEHDPSGGKSSDRMTSTITASNGQVSGSTTGSGPSVTVHSGNGSTSSSFATAGSSGGSTVVAGSGSGNCVVYKDSGRKVEKSNE